MKRNLLVLAALLATVATASAQTYRVHKTNGEVVKYQNDEVAYIDFVVEQKIEPVDLGLPSGTLWSPVNIGATQPEEYGDYFAWAEVATKEWYNWSNYTHCDEGNQWKMHSEPGTDIVGSDYDAAHVLWGENWVMPTSAQFSELFSICEKELTTLNDVKGYRFIGPNGNSVFFPLSGRYTDQYMDDTKVELTGSWGYYWSGTRYEYNDRDAYLLYIGGSSTTKLLSQSRYCGYPIRPVVKIEI